MFLKKSHSFQISPISGKSL